ERVDDDNIATFFSITERVARHPPFAFFSQPRIQYQTPQSSQLGRPGVDLASWRTALGAAATAGGEIGVCVLVHLIINLNQLHPPSSSCFDTHRSLRTPHLHGNQTNQLKVGLAIHWRRFDGCHPSSILRLRQAALLSVGFDFDL
ncbi:MAG: hypothetical protein RLZZ502_434, partial [Pseudomonadota bacterium]